MNTRTIHSMAIAVFATLLLSSTVFAASVSADPAAELHESGHPVVLTFTKWVTVNPTGGIMQGVVGGDVVGTFAGQVLVNQTTDLVKKLGPLAGGDINVLQAVYEVQAGERSFRALVQGGYDVATNKAHLEGMVLGGWRTGDTVHVEFKALGCDPVQTNAVGGTCFQGTITVTPGLEN
jgi:hypothetical protein